MMRANKIDMIGGAYTTYAPTGSREPGVKRNFVMGVQLGLTICALQVGTGGVMDSNFFRERGDKGYKLPGIEVHAKKNAEGANAALKISKPADDVANVLEKSGLSTLELAALLGVSRQAVYDWKSGKRIATENLQKLSDFSSALNILDKAGIDKSHQVLQRPVEKGQNFIDLVSKGHSATEIAEKLVSTLMREKQERDVLNSLFADRKLPTSTIFDDVESKDA